MEWRCLDTGCRSAAENMSLDQRLLEEIDPLGAPLLHLYDWQGDSATYGYFVKPGEYLDLDAAVRRGLSLARRPTGGGIIFHTTDLAFSVLVPAGHPSFSLNTMDNYAFVNRAVLHAVEAFVGESLEAQLLPCAQGAGYNFCMAKPTQYDVMVGGRKVGGAAQRRTKAGYLHQGSIVLGMPDEGLLREVLRDEGVVEAMQRNSYPLLQGRVDGGRLSEARVGLGEVLFCSLNSSL